MQPVSTKSLVLCIGATASLFAVASLSSYSAGVESGLGGVPANCSAQLPSCNNCHAGSEPFAGRVGGPTTTVSATKLALNQGETVSVTATVTGGVAGSLGGFVTEATSGAFTTGGNAHVVNSASSITHMGNSSRTWTFSFTAPSTIGPVSLTTCGMSADGASTGGDLFSFAGFDNNALTATPLRLYVLPAGVTNTGAACPDGFGNFSVLGASSVPAIGNASYAFELVGAAPGALAVVWAGINPAGFTPVDLGMQFGLTGCNGYLDNIIPSITATTSGGSAQSADGAASFPLPIPNSAVLQGQAFDVQGGYVDSSVAALRAMPLSFSNGLHVAIQ